MTPELILPPHGKPPQMHPQPRCAACGAPTPRQVLANLGSRCQGCYTAYCRSAFGELEPTR